MALFGEVQLRVSQGAANSVVLLTWISARNVHLAMTGIRNRGTNDMSAIERMREQLHLN